MSLLPTISRMSVRFTLICMRLSSLPMSLAFHSEHLSATIDAVPYASCPKCRYAPLPEDQALPAACPACGLVLAKYGTVPVRQPNPAHLEKETSAAGPGTKRERLAAWLLHVPAEVAKPNWIARIVTLAVFVLWTLWIWRDADVRAGEAGSHFLHMILLPFHEAGHYAIFRWFGQFIMTLGGTLGQHLLPIVLGVALLIKRRDPFGAAICLWLLGFSTVDMAVYMYDAFDPKIMLLGGNTGAESDGHDWQNMFGDLGLLRRSRGIGLFFGWVGKAMMFAALFWAAWVLWLQRARLSDSVFAESDIK
jgi:hypothetical protein